MKRLLFYIFMFTGFLLFAFQLVFAQINGVNAKLPYAKGESFVVTTGYNSPPTHIKKDAYAIDFTQNGCEAYGKPAVAGVSGTVQLVQEDGYNGGYGTQLLIVSDGSSDGNVVSRYAHLIPDSIMVSTGTIVRQGMALAKIGNTGLVAGTACALHPGAHLHFALYDKNLDGTFLAKNPEPISGYTDIQEGKWYLSDNGLDGAVLGATTNAATSTSISITAPIVPIGGVGMVAPVSVSPALPALPPLPFLNTTSSPVASTTVATSSPQANFTGSFNSSTLAIDFSWQLPFGMSTSGVITYSLFDFGVASSSVGSAPVASTTAMALSYPVPTQDFGHDVSFELQATDDVGNTFTFPEIMVFIPNWFNVIQSDDSAQSIGSWYDDNWYNLGTGFYGTIKSLTFEGAVNTDRYLQFPAHMWIQEFLDSDYTQLNQTFTVSDGAPFTDQLATVTISGLNIPLQPNKYYRLATYEQLQNHSILLNGTQATGTAMWDEFINGTGIVRHMYQFSPYISAIVIPSYPPLAPPNPPASFSFSFDQFGLTLGVGWPAATDPDTTGNLLTYQFNVSTSTSLDDSQWQPMGAGLATSIAVLVGNAYTVGVRAIDDFGNVSAPLMQTWHFPQSFVPYLLSGSLSTASQDFTLTASDTLLHSIELFTSSLSSGSKYPEYNWCTLDIYDLASGTTPVAIASNEGLNRGYDGCQGGAIFNFDASAVQLLPDHPYRWVFNMNTGNPSTGASVKFWGTATDTAGGKFSDPALVNAKFVINASSGVLFSN